MHTIEPHYHWRNYYVAEKDSRSPFHGREYSEFTFSNKVYNYFIHPQWDEFGSETLYTKLLFADYEQGVAILEFIGEWNDCINNDILFLKQEVLDSLINEGISKFVLIVENVLNFHGSDDSYYEEWYEDIRDQDSWIVAINVLDHVAEEMQDHQLQHFLNFGQHFNDLPWRPMKPQLMVKLVEQILRDGNRQLPVG